MTVVGYGIGKSFYFMGEKFKKRKMLLTEQNKKCKMYAVIYSR
jgi:hypothetical protein